MGATSDPERFVLVLLLTLALAAGHAAAYERTVASSESSDPRECPVQWQGHVLAITTNCTWGSTTGSGGLSLPASSKLSILGSRPVLGAYSSNSATPVIYAAAGAPAKPALDLGESTCPCYLRYPTIMRAVCYILFQPTPGRHHISAGTLTEGVWHVAPMQSWPACTFSLLTAVLHASAVTGVSLHLERLVLVGFQLSPPAAQQAPVLWPGGLVPGSGEQLNMTDVRVVISSQELFNKYLTWFTASNTLLWTVSRHESPIQLLECSCTAAHWCSSNPQHACSTSPGAVASLFAHGIGCR
jgi:hypothetical protein